MFLEVQFLYLGDVNVELFFDRGVIFDVLWVMDGGFWMGD